MDPLSQSLEALRQLIAPMQPVTNMALIRLLVRAEFQRLESPHVIDFLSEEERALFEAHQLQVKAFLESEDGVDAWALLVQAFRAFVDPPEPAEDVPEE